MRRLGAGVVAVLLSAAACADEMPRQSPPEFVEPAPPGGRFPPSEGLGLDRSPGTPADGYLDWIADLRGGLARVAPMAHTERESALRMIQDLYSSRHEPLERYFGHGGAMYMGDGLAQAVERSAAEFQELMRQLAAMDEDPARLQNTVRAADQALRDVEAEGQGAGLRPTAPHRDS